LIKLFTHQEPEAQKLTCSRPFKIPRTATDGDAPIDITALRNEFNLYFDTLDGNGLDHVAKYFRSGNWPSFTCVSDILPLLHVRGELGSFLRNRCFHSLRIVFRPDTHKPLKGEIFTTSLIAAVEFVSLAGRFVRSIHIEEDPQSSSTSSEDGEGHSDIEWNTEELAVAVSRHCPNVRTLEIAQESSEWVKEFGVRLESLSLATPHNIAVIERNCTSLRRIKLSLCTSFEATIAQSNIWKKIGGTLESINVKFSWAFGEELVKIQEHCRALRKINIPGISIRQVHNSQHSKLLSPYGHKLEYARECEFTEVELKTVTEACPNARFELIGISKRMLHALNTLGRQLEKSVFFRKSDGCDLEELGRAWQSCSNFKDALFFESDFGVYRAFFAHPKPSLKKVQCVGIDDDNITEILNLFTGRTIDCRTSTSMSSLKTTHTCVLSELTLLIHRKLLNHCAIKQGKLLNHCLKHRF